MSNFDISVSTILKHEGGYVNNPHDKGGETNLGISKRTYPNEDIKNMTVARAKQIYRTNYWNPINGDQIKDQNTATAILDTSVLSGPVIAKRLADSAAKKMGYKSSSEVPAEKGNLFNQFFGRERISFYKMLALKDPTQKIFLNGWIKRAQSFFSISKPKVGALAGIAAIGGLVAWYFKSTKKENQGA